MRKPTPPARLLLLITLLTALLSGLAAAQPPDPASQAPPERGLSAAAVGAHAAPALQIRSTGRFELTIDGGGIAGWVSYAADPGRDQVPAGGRLVAHSGAGGAPFIGTPRLVAASPVRAVVRIDGPGGSALTYTVWAGGQVAIDAAAAPGVRSELRLAPGASAGAALQQLPGGAMLYLDAWTPDGSAAPGDGAALASGPRTDATNTIVAEAEGAWPLRIAAPAGLLRQPRFRIAGWPGPQLSVDLAGRRLVQGADYLADWDAASGELTLQYLGLLPPGAGAARSFSFGLDQAPALGVEILSRDGAAARTLSPEGLLRVDANVPSQTGTQAPGAPTTNDIFDIPYIQTWPELRVRATVTSPPAGFGGVRFVVTGPGVSRMVDDTTPGDGLTAVISLPRRAEYSLTVSALVGGAPAAPSRTIARVAYGRVFVGVGDSVTAGRWGFFRDPGGDGYPFVAPPAAGSGYPVSADSRNYPQSDNTQDDLVGGEAAYENRYLAGYLPELNDALSACLSSPVFILNDGSSGIRTARDTYKEADPDGGNPGAQGYRNVLGKAAALRSHLRQLGAGQILLQIGTNDATTVISNTTAFNDPMPASLYNQDLRSLVAALRQDDPGASVWLARLPWRNDRRPAEPVGIEAQKQAKTREFNAEIVKVVEDLGDSAPVFLGPDFYSHFLQNPAQIAATDPSDTTPPISSDLLHPTAEGFSAMAELWAQVICQQIAAEPPPDSRPERLYLPLTRE